MTYSRSAVKEKFTEVLRDKLDVSCEKAKRTADALIDAISDCACESRADDFWLDNDLLDGGGDDA